MRSTRPPAARQARVALPPAAERGNAPLPEADAARGEGLGSVLEFLRIVWGLYHALQIRSKRMEAELGVTGPQRLVLRVVGRFPKVSAGELAKILQVHPSTLTGVLRRLEERGFVRRRGDVSDRRRALFELTRSGHALDAIKAGTVEAAARRALRQTASGTGTSRPGEPQQLDRPPARSTPVDLAQELLLRLSEELLRPDA
jgi:DNA-binding MarR family transcriptional regulator